MRAKNGVCTLFPELRLVESASPYPTMNWDCLISTPTSIRVPIERLDPLVRQLCGFDTASIQKFTR